MERGATTLLINHMINIMVKTLGHELISAVLRQCYVTITSDVVRNGLVLLNVFKERAMYNIARQKSHVYLKIVKMQFNENAYVERPKIVLRLKYYGTRALVTVTRTRIITRLRHRQLKFCTYPRLISLCFPVRIGRRH